MNFERAGIVLDHLFSGEHVRVSTDKNLNLLNYVDNEKPKEEKIVNKKLSSRDFIVPVDENEGVCLYMFIYLWYIFMVCIDGYVNIHLYICI
jgi:hypothetical protein